jgi:hypothetical protein
MTSRSTPLASRSKRRRAARRIVAIALIGLAGGLLSAPALGEPAAALTLRWQAPSACPQQAEVRERIRALTGSARPAGASLLAEGLITQTDSARFHLKLVTRSGGLVGERHLDASSCENLTGVAAVSVALLMRSAEPLSEGDLAGKSANGSTPIAGAAPGTAAATSGSGPAGTATTSSNGQAGATAATTTVTQPTTPTGGDGPRKRPRSASKSVSEDPDESELPPSEIIERPIRVPSVRKARVLAEVPLAVMSFGPLPKPSWGLAFAGGVSFENWRLLLGGTAWLRQHVASEQSPDFGADIDRLTGTFRGCRTLSDAKFEVAPCLTLSVEHITARGTGAGVTARSQQATWLAVGAGAQGRLHLTGYLALLVGVDAQIETARPVISIDGAGTVNQFGYGALTATVGPEWIF